MRNVSTADMRNGIRSLVRDPEALKAVNEDACKNPRTIEGYARDWALLQEWTDATHIRDLSEASFLAMAQILIERKKSPSRIENFRSAVAFRQNLDIDVIAGRWSQNKRFQTLFTGVLARAEVAYRSGQKEGTIPKTKRGSATREKVEEVMDTCTELGYPEYAVGFWLARGALLRHLELMALTPDHLRILANGTPQVLIIGGKGRPADYREWVDAPDCAAVIRALMERKGTLFPAWEEKTANWLIQETARKRGWEEDLRWVFHSTRRGGAKDLRLDGWPITHIMERGRWKARRVAETYAED